MIHVAPCSCELHVRIRELEAELRTMARVHYEDEARAEKAESRVAELERILDEHGIEEEIPLLRGEREGGREAD